MIETPQTRSFICILVELVAMTYVLIFPAPKNAFIIESAIFKNRASTLQY